MSADGKNVYFEKDILENFDKLAYPAEFKEFAKMAVREEINRRIRANFKPLVDAVSQS